MLESQPHHQRNHYQFAQLRRAQDTKHIEQMQAVLDETALPADRNVFLYYAIGKELEDLERWDEAFEFFDKAASAIQGVLDYDPSTDLDLIDAVIETCDEEWLGRPAANLKSDHTPIFLVGLPRSGTTLVERIVSSHSQVSTVDETQYMPMTIRHLSGIESDLKVTPAMIRSVAEMDIDAVASGYMQRVQYRLQSQPYFIDKLPCNILYLGFIARAYPDARIILMQRGAMDSCFAMFKQVFAGTYKFSYSLEQLGHFYVAYRRLARHWQTTLGDRILEVRYENLVAQQEKKSRNLVEGLGLQWEDTCLDFTDNRSATTTASSAQVRERIHNRSVGRWERYERQLAPLRRILEDADVALS